jgi:hypothetical protein
MLIIKTGSSIWTKSVCYASATLWTQFVIIATPCVVSKLPLYLWNVTCDVYVEWYDLGCKRVGLKSFVVSIDYRDYMGSSSKIWAFQHLFMYLCSYNLVGSVTAPERHVLWSNTPMTFFWPVRLQLLESSTTKHTIQAVADGLRPIVTSAD